MFFMIMARCRQILALSLDPSCLVAVEMVLLVLRLVFAAERRRHSEKYLTAGVLFWSVPKIYFLLRGYIIFLRNGGSDALCLIDDQTGDAEGFFFRKKTKQKDLLFIEIGSPG